jgi:hypothetical protein
MFFYVKKKLIQQKKKTKLQHYKQVSLAQYRFNGLNSDFTKVKLQSTPHFNVSQLNQPTKMIGRLFLFSPPFTPANPNPISMADRKMAEEGKCMRQLLNLKDSSFAISPQLF